MTIKKAILEPAQAAYHNEIATILTRYVAIYEPSTDTMGIMP